MQTTVGRIKAAKRLVPITTYVEVQGPANIEFGRDALLRLSAAELLAILKGTAEVK